MPKLTLNLDDLDAKAIHKAIAVHQRKARIDGIHMLPDHESDTAGATLAEICRGWLESRGEWNWLGKPDS